MPAWLEIALRSFVILIGIFFIIKFLGKKQISEMSFFEYVIGITIGAIAGTLSIDRGIPFVYGAISILIWIAIPILFNFLSLKNKKVRDFIEGKATIFIKDGKILEDNLKKENYSTDNLLSQLRKQKVFSVSDVEFATLESSGELSVLLKKDKQPVTPKDLNISTAVVKEPQTVIMDGEIMDEALKNRGLNRQWLKTELEKIGVAIENVFLGQVDTMGQLTVDLFDDKITVPEPVQIPLLLATIKKCQADLELFALATDSKTAKQMYSGNAKKIEKLLEKVTPLLQ
ncbi:hypothetical protein DCC39_02060 [Pueribacillus theae]|uniref:DUF421 domain-containing protein n=1 Tax=Pueribacillus theae TaxID=2171751 RepID=A0A2U1K853_9BACI|nr:DUF421 domain-containing protein [Pueribacillus theae]PWA13253.1 hypothetical protein DCC39_02060 [Pueribacillus theae]